MGADDGVDVVDDDLLHAEALLHLLGHVLGVLEAVAVRDEHHLLVDGGDGRLLHVVHQGVQRLLASAHLLQGDEAPLVVHVHDRLDVEHGARPRRGLRHAPAAEQEHEVVHGEPVRQVQLVLLYPVAHLVDGGAASGALHGVPHEQAFAARGGQRVHGAQLPLGELRGQLLHQELDGLVGTRQPAGEAQVQHVASLFQQPAHERLGVGQVRQRRGDHLAVAHHRVELLEVGVLPLEIALILLAVHHEGEGQDMQTEFVDHVLDEVAAGIGDDLEVHRHTTRPSLKLQRSEKPELPAVNMRSLKVYRLASRSCVAILKSAGRLAGNGVRSTIL